jgi:hypothetical protein
MLFYGAGSAQSTGVSNYGGVIYAYTQDMVFLWTPTANTGKGHMVYIADRWENDSHFENWSKYVVFNYLINLHIF